MSRSTRTARGGAARERLDREGAGAAVEVEHGGAGDALAERGEDRLADAVGGRAHLPAARRDQALPLQLSGDHPHDIGRYRSVDPAGIGSAAPAPKRRRAASSSGPRAGSASEPWRRSSASTSSRAAISSLRVLGQLGDGEARQAALAGAEDLALAAQAEVDLGELEAVALLSPPPPAGAAPSPPPLPRRAGTARDARRGRPGRAAGAAGRRRSARPPRSPSRSRWRRRSRPRSPSSPPARRSPRRRRPASPRPCRPSASGRGGGRPRSRAARRPAAARPRPRPPCPAIFSESSTSGQTTKAWRPSRSRSRRNS